MELLISSSNKDKIKEMKGILGDSYKLITKEDLDLADFDVEEDGETLAANAYKKAKELYDKTKRNVIADDTGLFVEALGGAPGVYSARYAGESCSYQDNVDKMLRELKEIEDLKDRRATFKTVLCLITQEGRVEFIEGRLEGSIIKEEKGSNGFGYDPIFMPLGMDKTLAELSDKEKNKISHRRNAFENLKEFLLSME